MIPVQVQAAHRSDPVDSENNRSTGQEKPENTICNIRNFGAKGDGITLDSPAINEAIEFSSSNGGGTVMVPAGVYLSGTIHLKSNLVLYIEAGATIPGNRNILSLY
jgi:polygalacturonase